MARQSKTSLDDLTPMQRERFAAVARITRSNPAKWYRAGEAGLGHPRGEAVTLQSLAACGLLKRRAWRGKPGERDAAYEYRLEDAVLAILEDVLAARRDLPVIVVVRDGEEHVATFAVPLSGRPDVTARARTPDGAVGELLSKAAGLGFSGQRKDYVVRARAPK